MFDENEEQMDPTELKMLVYDKKYKNMILAIYHSSLFYWFTYLVIVEILINLKLKTFKLI